MTYREIRFRETSRATENSEIVCPGELVCGWWKWSAPPPTRRAYCERWDESREPTGKSIPVAWDHKSQPGDRGKTVTKPLVLSRLGLLLSEKQIPQVVEDLESGVES